MKLYGVFISPRKGTATLETCEVEEETSEFYFLKRGSFTYDRGRKVSKNHPMIAFSSEVAIEKFVSRCERGKDNLEGRIQVLNKAIRDVKELRYENEK